MTQPNAPCPDDRVRPDDRGVSFTVSYVLTVAIAVILVAGIVTAAGQSVQSQQKTVVRDSAIVVSDETAATVMAADRLARAGGETAPSHPTTVTVSLTLPETLAGQQYTVLLNTSEGSATVIVTSSDPDIVVETPIRNETVVEESTVNGGEVNVVYRHSTGALTIEEADG